MAFAVAFAGTCFLIQCLYAVWGCNGTSNPGSNYAAENIFVISVTVAVVAAVAVALAVAGAIFVAK